MTTEIRKGSILTYRTYDDRVEQSMTRPGDVWVAEVGWPQPFVGGVYAEPLTAMEQWAPHETCHEAAHRHEWSFDESAAAWSNGCDWQSAVTVRRFEVIAARPLRSVEEIAARPLARSVV